MISPVYQGGVAESGAPAAQNRATGIETAMGQDAFLKMFMAQMTNQNPLDPMDNTEFTSQLAQFTSLEQLTKISKQLEGLDGIKEAADQAAVMSYIGKEVTVAGDVLPISDGHVGEISFQLDGNADVRAVVTGEAGNTVAILGMGRVSAGPHKFQWDGKDHNGNPLPDGVYKVTIMAHDAQGTPVPVNSQTVTALVSGYQKDKDGNAFLLLGEAAVPLKDVIAVRSPAAAEDGSESEDDEDNEESGGGDGEQEESGLPEILQTLVTLGGLAAALL